MAHSLLALRSPAPASRVVWLRVLSTATRNKGSERPHDNNIPRGNHARSAELFADLMLGSHPIMTYTNWNAEPPTEQDLIDRVNLFIRGSFDHSVVEGATTRVAKLPN